MTRKFNPEGMTPPPFYSHGVEVQAGARMVFVSGQVGVRRDGTVAEDIGAQAAVAIENLTAVLAAADMTPADIVKSRSTLPTRPISRGSPQRRLRCSFSRRQRLRSSM